ncbi:MAG TPA: hypothetical protein VES68_02310 [Candidatus Sulfotelmatobacter sp.]|nr:hypothetical protein [Candidatus Sulfotelmatobacter sp.]
MANIKGIAGTRSRKKIKTLLSRVFENKRQRFIFSVIILSLGLFAAEHLLGKSGLFIVFGLSILTSIFLYISLKEDLKDNFTPQVFILPFFYSLSVGFFYLLVPARFLTRIGMTTLYAIGLYSLFLSQNIFTVSSIRTIALLSGARTVSLVLTLLSYFFLSNVVFSFHINIFITLILIFIYTFPTILQAIWIHTLEKKPFAQIFWVLSLSICLVEISLFLWLGPSSPTVSALFLTAMFYVFVGLSQAWFEKRLFRSVILEYFWLTTISFVFLIIFTNWI